MLVEQINICFGHTAVRVGALTGVAARLIHGTTFHTLLKLPVQKDGFLIHNLAPLTGNVIKVMRSLWKNIEYLFIDEISMVPYEMLCMIDLRLRQLKKNENVVFGGLNIIVFGDLFQLAPVKGAQVFKQPPLYKQATHLWRLFSLVELKQNMRQQGDTTFADLLKAVRVGELNGQHFQILMNQLLKDDDLIGNFSFDNAIRVYPTRELVRNHNQMAPDYHRLNGTKKYTIKANDRIVNAMKSIENINIDTIISKDENKRGGLLQNLELFVGAKVMLRSNIDVRKRLDNGAMRQVIDFVWGKGYRRDQLYHEDIPDIRIDFEIDGIHVIKPISVQFDANAHHGTAERRQLPVILCWAAAVHKLQGSTVDRAVVYLGKRIFAKGQAHVTLRRVRSLDGLRIVDLECDIITDKMLVNEEALKEMERIRNYRPHDQI